MKVESDKWIQVMAIALMTSELNQSANQKPHRHHPLCLDTENFILGNKVRFHELERLLRDGTPSYFFFTYILSHSWPGLEPIEFPPFLERYEPGLRRSGLNREIRGVLESGTLEKLQESQKPLWNEVEKDAIEALVGNSIERVSGGFLE